MEQLNLTLGKASLYKKESYNHGTSIKVNWLVKVTWPCGKVITVRDCKTRKEALTWVNIYKD